MSSKVVFLIVLLGVSLCALAQKTCEPEDYKQCFKELKKDKDNKPEEEQMTEDSLNEKCRLYADGLECMKTYEDVCKQANKWEKMETVSFGYRNFMTALCNDTAVKADFVKNLACFKQYKPELKVCTLRYKQPKEGTDPAKKACCKNVALQNCHKEVWTARCPDAKDVLEKLAGKLAEKTQAYCEMNAFTGATCMASAIVPTTTPKP
jgi:hypothetical protein